MSDHSEDRRAQCADSAPYLLGALSPAAVDAFEGHLAGCPACQDACDDIGPAASALGGLSAADVRELLDDRVRDDPDRLDPPTAPRPPASRRRPHGPGFRLPVTVGRSGPFGSDRLPSQSSGPGGPLTGTEKPSHSCLLVRSLARWGRLRLRVVVTLGMLAVLDACAAVVPGYDGE
ncbi:zf-HC2 domain-containing protein [Micromonospora pisi]|nr:zf-HC2 domain-containing protein [Micromonospora pisi]